MVFKIDSTWCTVVVAFLIVSGICKACENGSYTASPNDCTSFFICNNGKETQVQCPNGLYYNPEISTCDWPQNVNCGSDTTTLMPTTLPPDTTTQGIPTSTPCTPNPGSSTSTANPVPSTSTAKPVHSTTTAKPVPSTTTANPVPSTTTANPGPNPNPSPSPSMTGIKFAPYFDVMLDGPTLTDVYTKTGQKDYTLAFVLGSSEGCVPKWGAALALNDSKVLGPVRYIQSQGGQVIAATGGAVGPYFEQLCTTVDTLANAYKQVLDTVKTNHLDIDVESTINTDLVNKALAKVQRDRPSTTVSYTLMVQAEDYGLNPPLGSDVLKSAKANGVRVDLVNPMAMEFGGSSSNWGDAVVNAAKSVLGNMKQIWPEKSDTQLKKMLGVTPMIGRNFNGRVFQLDDARKLVNWANQNHIGQLAFWSVARDNGKCPSGGVSATCSSISQDEYAFIKIFQGFNG